VVSPASAGPPDRKAAITEEVLALVQNLQPDGRTHAVADRVAGGNGHSAATATLELPPAMAEETPVASRKETIEPLVRPLIETTNIAPPAAAPEPVGLASQLLSEAMELQAELVLDSMAQQNIAEQSVIRGIVASFQQLPKPSLLPPATENVVAPAPVCIQWMRMPRPRLIPVPPKDLNHKNLFSGLQTPPLAGPCVPQELRSLTKQHSRPGASTRKKAGLPAWTVSFAVALTLFLGVGSLLQYLGANREAKAAAATSQPSDQSSSSAPTSELPSSKLVEVTGLRIAAGANQRPQLEFLVVNHSAVPLSDVGLNIAVRSATSHSGVAPLFRVSTTIPSLGAYQSREFRAELDPQVHATEIPDWQSLRAEVRITQ